MNLKQAIIEELATRIETVEYNLSSGCYVTEGKRDWLEGRIRGYRDVIDLLKG